MAGLSDAEKLEILSQTTNRVMTLIEEDESIKNLTMRDSDAAIKLYLAGIEAGVDAMKTVLDGKLA